MRRHRVLDWANRYRGDAMAYPFQALGATLLGTTDGGVRDNPNSSTTGLPAIVIPAGLNEEGLPIAIEVVGLPFSEPKLIKLAHAYEQASHRRVAPKSTPHLQDEVFSY